MSPLLLGLLTAAWPSQGSLHYPRVGQGLTFTVPDKRGQYERPRERQTLILIPDPDLEPLGIEMQLEGVKEEATGEVVVEGEEVAEEEEVAEGAEEVVGEEVITDEEGKICVRKVMMVEETEYDEVLTCDHSYDNRCTRSVKSCANLAGATRPT